LLGFVFSQSGFERIGSKPVQTGFLGFGGKRERAVAGRVDFSSDDREGRRQKVEDELEISSLLKLDSLSIPTLALA